MLVKIRLGDKDRERFDCAEWLPVDPLSVSIREAILLQKGVEVDGGVIAFDSPAAWRLALNGHPLIGEDGEPVTVEAVVDGETTKRIVKVANYDAEMVLVWLALKRAGTKVALGDVDYDSDDLDWSVQVESEDAGELGKDPSTPETTSS